MREQVSMETGPLFLDPNLYGKLYYEILNDQINPFIIHQLENQINAREEQTVDHNILHFRQEGAPSHHAT